jgi:hypothetical protein
MRHPVRLGLTSDLDAAEAVFPQIPVQSATHSTCCSIDGSMLVSTEVLPGLVIVKRFGKPAVPRPR